MSDSTDFFKDRIQTSWILKSVSCCVLANRVKETKIKEVFCLSQIYMQHNEFGLNPSTDSTKIQGAYKFSGQNLAF